MRPCISWKGRRGGQCALALSIVAAALLVAASSASAADFEFCSPGSGAGQCSEPLGVAADTSTSEPSSGHVYVADRGNNRIDVFSSTGTFLFAFGWGVANGASEAQTCGPAASPPTASCSAGIAGSGSGQFNKPESVAVDNVAASASRHDIYVGTDNFRVQKFNPEGHLLRMWGWDVVQSGPDNAGTGFEVCVPASGDVCKGGVAGGGQGQFGERPDSIGVGPGGVVYVEDNETLDDVHFINRVEKFEASGAFNETVALAVTAIPQAFAVDPASGDFYLASNTKNGVNQGIARYHPDGTLYGSPYPLDLNATTLALAVDGSGDLFASQSEPAAKPGSGARYPIISKYDPSGQPLRRFAYGASDTFRGIAAYPALNAGVFAGQKNNSRIQYLEVPPAGPIAVPPSVEVSPVGNAKATLNAEINPEGKETSYRFQFVTQAAYVLQGNSFVGPGTVSTPELPASLGNSELFNLHYVSTVAGCPNPLSEASEPGKCLLPETKYRFRVIATNADNPTGSGEGSAEGEFETKPPLEIVSSFATQVGIDTARINAGVNPLGVPAGAYFEVVGDAKFKESAFATAKRVPSSGELKLEEEGAIASQVLSSLTPDSTYHYRVSVVNPLIGARILGPPEEFNTFAVPGEAESCPANEAFRVGPSALLPDCRAYEMVSPVDKEGGNIVALGEATTGLPAVLEQASVPGAGEAQRLAYGSYRAFGDAGGGPFTSQYVATRGEQGWESVDISPPHGRVNAIASGFDTELKELSPSLCQSWWRTLGEPKLAPKAILGQPNLYRRSESACGAGPVQWEALTTVTPPHAFWGLELQGTSADGGAAIFATKDSLPTPAPKAPEQAAECSGVQNTAGVGCVTELYYQSQGEGQPRYVCVLPSAVSISGGCAAGTAKEGDGQSRRNLVHNAISADGSRVYWTAAPVGPGQIYLRINPGLAQSPAGECKAARACTLAVSEEAEIQAGSSRSQYLSAARDGSKAIFSTEISPTSFKLYEYDAAEGKDHLIAGRLVTGAGDAGVLGASEDASRVYLASEEVLSGANPQGDTPQVGKPNLYLYDSSLPEGARFHFVMALAPSDATSSFSPIRLQPLFHAARVTPDGLRAAFMSQAKPPSGYDNADAVNGEADAEVYLYDAAANAGKGKLECVSCNPTKARPVGVNMLARGGGKFWAAGRLPVWENTLYAARALSDGGGRLFFESTDTLSPRDTNGTADVYEWQAPGSGSCKEGAPDYFAANGGCLDLISTGKSSYASRLVDANPNGSDVFIATLQSLATQDPGLLDIYDARELGGYPAPPPIEPECEAEACQHPQAAPQFATPPSLSYQGPGNVKPAKKHSCPKGKASHAGHKCTKKHKNGKSKHRTGAAKGSRGQ